MGVLKSRSMEILIPFCCGYYVQHVSLLTSQASNDNVLGLNQFQFVGLEPMARQNSHGELLQTIYNRIACYSYYFLVLLQTL